MTDLVAARSPFVDGRFVTGDAGALGVVSPSTEEVAFEVEASSVAQFDAAIEAARRVRRRPLAADVDGRARQRCADCPTRCTRATTSWWSR